MRVEWRAYPKLIADEGAQGRLEHRLSWVAARFREHGVCVEWARGRPFDAASVYTEGEKVPHIVDLKPLGSAPLPRLILVPHLVGPAEDGRRHERRGATPGAGANVAVVRIVDGRGDGIAMRDELLHVLGLTDAEMGVSRARPRHVPTAEQWQFVRSVCEASRDDGAKRRTVVEKEECLARAGDTARSDCYRTTGGQT